MHEPENEWRFALEFKMEQVPHLWCGIDPGFPKYSLDDALQRKIGAAEQHLTGAVLKGALPSSISEIQRKLGTVYGVRITRVDLEAYARSIGQTPAFLFDTLIDREEPEPKNKGGRPAEHDWNACTLEVIRYADLNNLPDSQAELVRHLLGWFSDTFDKEPAESAVKAFVSKIYNGLGRGQKPKLAAAK